MLMKGKVLGLKSDGFPGFYIEDSDNNGNCCYNPGLSRSLTGQSRYNTVQYWSLTG